MALCLVVVTAPIEVGGAEQIIITEVYSSREERLREV